MVPYFWKPNISNFFYRVNTNRADNFLFLKTEHANVTEEIRKGFPPFV